MERKKRKKRNDGFPENMGVTDRIRWLRRTRLKTGRTRLKYIRK